MHAVESVWCCASLQAVQAKQGDEPLALNVLPGTQLLQAVATQLPPLAV